MPNPAGVSSPRFSLSAICQICIFWPVSTLLNLPCSRACTPLLAHLTVVGSFRKISLPPLQSPHQSFRYPLRKTIGRRGVAPRGSGGGWDALKSKGSQLQSGLAEICWTLKLYVRCTSRCCDSRSAMSLTISGGPPRTAVVDVQCHERSSSTTYIVIDEPRW